MPSVMQKIVLMPGPTASRTASGAPPAGHEDAGRVRAGLADGLGDGVEHGHASRRAPVWPPLPGVTPATSGVPYSCIAREWNSPSRPVMPWTTSRVSRPIRMLMRAAFRARGDGLLGRLVERRRGLEVRLAQQALRLLGIRADDADHHRARRAPAWTRGLDEPPRDLVAAGDAAEDVHEDRLDVRVGEDQAHRGRDPLGAGAAADVEEVRGLAAGALHEVHRGHREAGAVDHAADRAVELDEADVVPARLERRSGPPRRGRASPRARGAGTSAESSRVIFASRQTSRSCGAVGPRSRTIGERVDLDEVGVVREHRPDERPSRSRPPALRCAAEAQPERELARLPVAAARAAGRRGRVMIASGLSTATCSISTPPSAEPMSRIRRAARSRTADEVVLLDDVGGGRHEDLADRDALDRHAEDRRRRRCSASSSEEASFTPPALPRPPTSTWALITTWRCVPAPWSNRDAAARASAAVRATSHGGHGQALGEQQRLRVGFLDLHGTAMVARRYLAGVRSGQVEARASPIRSSAACDFASDQMSVSSNPSLVARAKRSARPSASASVPFASSPRWPGSWSRMPDRSPDLAPRPPDVVARGVQVGEPLAGDVVEPAEPGGVPGVGVAGGQPEHPLALGRDQDRRPPCRRRQELRARRSGDQRPSKSTRSPSSRRLMTSRSSSNRPTRWSNGNPNAAYSGSCQPQPRPRISRPPETSSSVAAHLGHQAGVPERRAHDERAELDARDHRRQGRQDRPGLVEAFVGLAREAEDQVVEHPDRVEAGALGALREVERLGERRRAAVSRSP